MMKSSPNKITAANAAARLSSYVNTHFQDVILALKDHARANICR